MTHLASRREIHRIADAGMQAAMPYRLVGAAIEVTDESIRLGETVVPRAGLRRVVLLAAGKGARAAAQTTFDRLSPHFDVVGRVLTDGDGVGLREHEALDVNIVRPPHWNRPTARAVLATRAALADARALTASDLFVVLLSGGGSAMLCAPRPPVTLVDKVETIDVLDAAGAAIDLLNAVRRRISDVKGGRLAAAAAGARATVGLLLSDVDDDDPRVIASGPLTGGPDTIDVVERVRALGVLDRLPASVRAAFDEPLPTDRAPCHVYGSAADAVRGACERARRDGYDVVDLGRGVSGDYVKVAELHVRTAREAHAAERPVCIVSAGESTARLPEDHGSGGRASHLALAISQGLRDERELGTRWTVGVVATDGEDGDAGAADAYAVAGASYAGALAHLKRDPAEALLRCDSHSVMSEFGFAMNAWDSFRTNVQDLRVILVEPATVALKSDRERWDARYAQPGRRRDGGPSRFLEETVDTLPSEGRALDVACGEGGDVVRLAQHGLEVTGIDVSPVGLAKARSLAAEHGVSDRVRLIEHDLTLGLPAFDAAFDVISVVHYWDRALLGELVGALAPSGFLIVEVPTTENVALGLPSPPERWLAGVNELLQCAPGCVVRVYQEVEDEGLVRARLIAQKRAARHYPLAREDDDHGTDGDEG